MVQSPFAQARRYRPWGDVFRLLGGRYSSFIAPTGSCANPVASPLLRLSASLKESLQVATSPLLPTGSSRRYLCESFLGCLVPYHDGPTECVCLFLPLCHRPSPTEVWVGFPFSPANTTFHGSVFRGSRHFLIFRPPSLLTSQIVPTAALLLQGSRGFYVRAEHASLASACIGYASRPNQATDGAGTLTLQDSQPCQLLPTAHASLLWFLAVARMAWALSP